MMQVWVFHVPPADPAAGSVTVDDQGSDIGWDEPEGFQFHL